MDKDKKTKHQRSGIAKGVANSQQREQEQNQRSRWTSNSKFNRILGNLERSILGQFNNNHDNIGNNNVNSNESEKSLTKQTIAKRKHAVNQQAKENGSASVSNTTIGANQPICSNNGNQTLERSRQSTNGNRVSSISKASVAAKAASETLGKLTLEKCQQHSQTHKQQHQHFTVNSNQILATNKLPIPPPHANDEARNMNRNLLFGGGVPLTHTDQSSNVASTNLNVDPANTVIREPFSDNTDKPHDDVFGGVRVNSSPASSAKSLPAIGPKPRSHLTKQSNNNCAFSTNKEEEESGFSTYQSRRSFLLNHQLNQQQQLDQQHQQQQVSKFNQNVELNKDKMMLMRANQTTHPPSASNQLWNSMMINTSANFQNHRPMQQDSQSQYNQPINITSNQVPIQPVNPRYRNFYPSISQRDSTQNFMPNQHVPIPPIHPSLRSNMNINLCNSNQLQQIHRYSERQMTIDSEQHIYANAPPKPRRYQYYDMTSNSKAPMISQMGVPANPMLTSIQPASNSINSHLVNSQISYNQPHTAPRQMSYPSNIAGQPQATSNISRLSVPNSYLTNDDPNAIHQKFTINYLHQPPKQHQYYPDATLTKPVGHPMVKSKSSLDTGDLVRYRQVRQSNLNALQAMNHRQPIYSSEIENSPNTAYRHHQAVDPNPFHNLSQVSQLQRSRSVTHLLPEVEQSIIKTNQAAYQDQVSTINRKFTSYSSASTNQMNLVGSSQAPQFPLTNSHLTSQQSRLIMHPFSQPNNIDLRNDLNHQQRQRQAINNWTEYQRHNGIMTHQQQLNKSKSMAAPNNNFSNRVSRNSMGNYQDVDGYTKPSLDDQIKHLLIGKNDSIDTAAKNLEYSGDRTINNNCDNGATYQTSSINNRVDLTESCSNATKSTQTIPVGTNGNEKIVHVTPRQHPPYQQAHANATPIFTLPQNDQSLCHPSKRDVGLFDTAKLQTYVSSNISRSSFSLAEIGDKIEMGNHQQRQYHVQQLGNEQTIGNMARRRQSDANSHLIVDLTTPRVLARTQTTLIALDNQANSDQCWSINQVGLPQFNSISSTSSANYKKPSPTTEGSVRDNKRNEQDVQNMSHNLSPIKSIDSKEEPKSNTERNAPYYYSDLKSEAQRQALMNIVQQKSLSPPPQLLSRSTDQNNTRLGLKSATMHSSHARTLSENLAERQRVLKDAASKMDNSNPSWSRKNQSSTKESNATTNIAKNIDKLFERPISGQTAKISNNAAAQSMLALNDCKEMKDLNHFSLDQGSVQYQTESISSGYCSSELKSKNLSKSKSLDNISQRSKIDESTKCLTNPVYENIRCSNKLLTAINDATNCLVTKTTSSNMKSLTTTNSDESMDSILGSSLEDSDSGSDIIDEIKISSTDNHLNDISDIIAQLKINHCKLSEKHKSTLVRISKTINSKNKQDSAEKKSDIDEVERRLRLLEMKSKKCESRSKNQLALIQMMEKVLKQSKLRASGNNRSASQHTLSNGTDMSRLDATPSISGNEGTKASLNLSTQSNSSVNGTAVGNDEKIDLPVSTTASSAANHEVNEIKTDSPKKSEFTNPSDKTASSNNQVCTQKLSQEIIKAIVTEKQADSAVFKLSKATIASATNMLNDIQQSRSEINGICADMILKDNTVTRKILDIEQRNSLMVENNKINQDIKAFHDNSKANDHTSQSTPVNADVDVKDSTTPKNAELMDTTRLVKSGGLNEPNDLMRDEDDFIEYLSDDISGHRSQFEASQFSASDFNTSTSVSESSTIETANDSINVFLSNHEESPGRRASSTNGYRREIASANSSSKTTTVSALSTVGILKNKRRNCHDNDANIRLGGEAAKANRIGKLDKNKSLPDMRGDSKEKNSTVGMEKFKNVLGNVIDVDICPMNSLSHSSPVNNQA